MTNLILPESTELARAPLIEHLTEFRARLIKVVIAFLAACLGMYLLAPHIYEFLVAPLAAAYPDPEHRRMIYTGLTEAFFTYLKLACFGGFILAFPVLAWQLYRFLAPGLYKRERRLLIPFLIAAPVLFLLGAALAYYIILPAAWHFFLGFEQSGAAGGLPIQLEARVGEYLDLVMHIILAFGLSFQMPILLALLAQAGIVGAQALANGRRYALVAMVIFAGVVTPPDVFSQLALFVPMIGLYECSILACRLLEKRKNLVIPAQAGTHEIS